MKPILFNTDMVKAILKGRKTVTRRVVKPAGNIQPQKNGLYTLFAEGTCYENQRLEDIVNYLKPLYKVGDVLYVRETWNWYYTRSMKKQYIYRATNENKSGGQNWKPSLHMPKEAARLFLKVTDVRVEKLHDMELEDFIKEGIILSMEDMTNHDMALWKARELFKDLWNSTAGKPYSPERYSNNYYRNPYVWVIEFEVITAEQAQGN